MKSITFSLVLLFLVSLHLKLHSSLFLHGLELFLLLLGIYSSLGPFSNLLLLSKILVKWVLLNWFFEAVLDGLLKVRYAWLVKVNFFLLFLLFLAENIHEVLLGVSFLRVHLHLHKLVDQGCLRNFPIKEAKNVIQKAFDTLPFHGTLPEQLLVLLYLFLFFFQGQLLLINFQQPLLVFLVLQRPLHGYLHLQSLGP